MLGPMLLVLSVCIAASLMLLLLMLGPCGALSAGGVGATATEELFSEITR